MKKTSLLLVLLFFAFGAFAQQQTEYNRRGDEAMERLNYRDAKIWYEEGVSNCDAYSINQLTSIWLADESMRTSLRSVMGKCLSCLNDRAIENKDTTSVKKLILYYTEGIGTEKNEATANFWATQLKALRNPYAAPNAARQSGNTAGKAKMEFFAGYSFSAVAPFGLTIGGVGKHVGWYVRFRSNLSFQGYAGEFEVDESGLPLIGATDKAYQYLGSKKASSLMGTGGVVINVAKPFCISAGLGYWKRDVMYKFRETDLVDASTESEAWMRHKGGSYDGLAVDLDGMFRFGKTVYASAGASVCNFKYVYFNAGLGVFF